VTGTLTVADIDRVLRDVDLDLVFPGRLVAPWDALPYAAAIDRVIDTCWAASTAAIERLTELTEVTTLWSLAHGLAWQHIGAADRTRAWTAAVLTAEASHEGFPYSGPTLAALLAADLTNPYGPLTPTHIDQLLTPWISVHGDPRDPS
jgi:hypothetical protein